MEQTLPAATSTPVDATQLAGSVHGSDLSVISLFLQADVIVKLVMLMLLFASFWTWAIIFEKAIRLRKLQAQAKQFEEAFWSGGSLEVLFDRLEGKALDAMSAVFVAAMREWRRTAAKGLVQTEHMRATLQERIERVMDITLGREMEGLERHMVYLASVGSAAPFVGLFGTVWGIVKSFASIGAAKSADLAVVAPGISEALVATAAGLVAAIPAVWFFNALTAQARTLGSELDHFAIDVLNAYDRSVASGGRAERVARGGAGR